MFIRPNWDFNAKTTGLLIYLRVTKKKKKTMKPAGNIRQEPEIEKKITDISKANKIYTPSHCGSFHAQHTHAQCSFAYIMEISLLWPGCEGNYTLTS